MASSVKEEYFKAISENNAEKVREILSTGFDVNTVNPQGATGLMLGAMKGNLEVVVDLLNQPGIDIHYSKKGFGNALNSAVMKSSSDTLQKEENRIDIIRLLLQRKIDENQKMGADTPLDKARKNFPKALPLLTRNLWKGMTQDELVLLNQIFNESTIFNPSADQATICPVCAKPVTREEGCPKLGHNCALITPHYNKELYEKYNHHGDISWCALCNRVQKDYAHYKLAKHDEASPTIEGSTCGGLVEKFVRINAYRKKIHELQSQINTISAENAIKAITEAAWDAPLVIAIPAVRPDKWEIPLEAFITRSEPVEEVLYSFPYDGLMPILVPKAMAPVNALNIVNYESHDYYIQFRHIANHPLIGFKSLIRFVKSLVESQKIQCFCEGADDKKSEVFPDEFKHIHDSFTSKWFDFPESGFNKAVFKHYIDLYTIEFNRQKTRGSASAAPSGALVGGGAAQPVGGAGSTRKQKGFGYRKSRKTRKNLKRSQHRRCRKNG